MKAKIFLVLISLFSLVSSSHACRCLPTTLAEHVKRNNLIFVGQIVDKISAPTELKDIYQISVEKIFKNQTSMNSPEKLKAVSGHHSCGVRYKAGDKFIFIVTAEEGQEIQLHSCQKVLTWDEDTIQNPDYQELLTLLKE